MKTLHAALIPACLGLACAASPAGAVAISNLTASASYNTPVFGLNNLGPTSSPASVDILHFATDTSGNGVGIHTYADSTSQSFGSRASGSGNYDVTSTIQVSITGAGDTLSSTVIPGQAYVQVPTGYTFGAGEFVSSHLKFSLYLDGNPTPVYTSEALIQRDSGGLTNSFSETGFSIGYTLTSSAGYDAYTFGASTQLFTGLDALSPAFAGNHSLEYVIFAEAHGLSHLGTCTGGGGNHQGGADGTVPGGGSGGTYDCYPGSGAQSGDPLGNVPEPGSLALLAAGLAALSWPRGRRAARLARGA